MNKYFITIETPPSLQPPYTTIFKKQFFSLLVLWEIRKIKKVFYYTSSLLDSSKIHHLFYINPSLCPVIGCFKASRAISAMPGILACIECGQLTKVQTLKENWCIFSKNLSIASSSLGMIEFHAHLPWTCWNFVCLGLVQVSCMYGCLVSSDTFCCVSEWFII